MIETEYQYWKADKERGLITEGLANAMSCGCPPHIEPIVWRISIKTATTRGIELEELMQEYRNRRHNAN
jgi:hypothetical protein